jgi:hypothetical protein
VLDGPAHYGSNTWADSVRDSAKHPTNGNLAVGFTFGQPVGLGVDTFSPSGGSDSAIVSFGSSLSVGWAKQIGGSGVEEIEALAYHSDGDLIAAGRYTGTFSLGGGLVTPPLGTSVFVVKLSKVAPHDVVWAKSFGSDQPQYVVDLDVDADGNVLVSLILRGAFDIDGMTINGGINGQGALIMLDGDDAHALWTKVLEGPALSAMSGSAVTPDGNIAIGGSFQGTLDLAQLHSGNGTALHAFVAMLAFDGTPLWSHTSGGASGTQASTYAVEATADGTVYAAGATAVPLTFGAATDSDAGVWVAQFAK